MQRYLYKNRKILCPVFAFLIPIILMTAVSIISGFYPYGHTSILMADMRYQFVDYFGYMKQIFFDTDTYFYSFSKTFGGDMAGLAAYYCNNPFLVFLLFVPNDLLPGGILIMMTVMLGFIGLTFNIFLNEVYTSRYTSLIFSTAYAFTGYLMGYFNCVQYFFNILMLPLVMLGIYRMVRDEKISILYIISQALSVFSCYYIGYMICIFSVCFFIYNYLIINKDIKGVKDIKNHSGSIISFITGSVTGVGLSAVSLLCAVISLRGQSSRKHIPLSLKGNFNITEIFSGLYSNAFHGNVSDGLPLIYSGAVALVFILIFYLGKTASKREKIISGLIFIFLILGFYIDFLNVFWHGFSYPIGFPYRNSFLFSFWVLFLAYKTFINIENTDNREIVISSFVYVIYSIYMCVILNENVGPHQVLITGVYIIISYVLIIIYRKKKFTYYIMPAFFILTLIDLSYNSYVSLNGYFPDKETDTTITIEAFRDFVDETSAIVDRIKEEDPGLYRIEKLYRRSNNDAMLIGYNGLSHFSSCETEQAMKFLEELGFRNNGNWAFYGDGSTSFADCFMGVKYMLSQYDETPKPYEKHFEYSDKTIFKNPYALPLCFTMDDNCLEIKREDYDHFSYQNALSRSIGYDGRPLYRQVEDVTIEAVNLEKNGNSYSEIDPEKESYIELSFINQSSDFMFMYFDADDFQDTKIIINDIEKQPYFTPYGWSIRELGYFPQGDKITVRIYALQDKITLRNYEFYYEDKAAVADFYQAAVQDKTEIEKITSDHLVGSVESNGDKILVFTVPYEDVWKVYVDGARVEDQMVLEGLLGVKISKGRHNIELRYIPNGFVLGMPISIIFIIILMILIIGRKRNNANR